MLSRTFPRRSSLRLGRSLYSAAALAGFLATGAPAVALAEHVVPPPPAPVAPASPSPPAPAAPPPPAAPTPAPSAGANAPSAEPPPSPPPPAVAPPPAPPVVAPAAAAPAPVATRQVLSPGEAIVHVAVSHRDAWLETRSYVDGGEFQRTCAAPCDLKLHVEGSEARVVAPGMTPSNVFRFDSGSGVAGVRVNGGSASARRAGIITLAAGIPVALAGMAMFALGRVHDKPGLEGGGIAGLAVGGISVAISLPLLIIGTTSVKNAKGSQIALGSLPGAAF